MRLIVAFLTIFLFAYGCKQNSKSKGAGTSAAEMADTVYTIHGYIKGGSTGNKAVLTILGADRIPDTAIFKGDEFEFKGKVTEPIMGEILLMDSSNKISAPLKLIVENAFINIEGNKDSIEKATVIGGLQNKDLATLKKVLALYTDSMNHLAVRAQEASAVNDTMRMQNIGITYQNMEKETRNVIKQYTVEHPSSIAVAFYVYQNFNFNDIKQLDTIYKSFDSTIHNTFYVKKIKETLDASQRTAIGQPAPELELNDVNNNPIRLSSYKGKYVLVDFWASWCIPCRQENPNLLSIYKKYKSKGFAMLGVSLDKEKQEWMKAIKTDKLPWKQVSDLKGWESTAVHSYAVGAIPTNFLIDKEGKIIAKDIRAEDLDKKLMEVLQQPS